MSTKRKEFEPPETNFGVLDGGMRGISIATAAGTSEERPPTPKSDETSTTTGSQPRERLGTTKRKASRHTYNVSDETHQLAVNAVDFLSGPPHREQLGRLVDRAISREVRRLAAAENNGDPFPDAGGPLRTGKRAGG